MHIFVNVHNTLNYNKKENCKNYKINTITLNNIMENKKFGQYFKNARESVQKNGRKMTQKEVAEQLEICQSNISDWENDISRPSYEFLIELAKIYDTTLYDLLGIPDDRL